MNDLAITRILDLARWAPSGDNTQPWRFEITGNHSVRVHGHDTREHCVYDLHGHASQVSIGALLETIAIAASAESLDVDISRCPGTPESRPTFDLHFIRRQGIGAHPLLDAIRRRAVKRGWMSTRRLSDSEKSTLERAAGPGYSIRWFESPREHLAAGVLMFKGGRIRYRIPEAFATHQAVIAWQSTHSMDRIPDQALGVGALQLGLMRQAMRSWNHMKLVNRLFAGAWTAPIQMDFLPALACGAHFVLLADEVPTGTDDYIKAGRAVQRLWLTATSLGLWQQPEMAPLIFSEYARSGTIFTRDAKRQDAAREVNDYLERLLGSAAGSAVWMGRIGSGSPPKARATRLPLEQLLRVPSGAP